MFKLLKIENSRQNVPEPEYLAVADAETVSEGEALVLTNGKLTKCGATVTPTFIAMASLKSNDTNRVIAVCRIEKNQVYEVPVVATPTALNVGDKVTLHTDGLQVTATTTSGVITIVSLNGATVANDKIVVRI